MKILYVTTVASTMGFFVEHIKMLLQEGHSIELACNCDVRELPQPYREMGLNVHNIPFSRSPFSADNLTAYRQLKKLVKDGGYDIVHTHTPNASAIVRLACRGLRKKGLKVMYTAHGFHFYKGAPLKNWLLYYPVEWLCSWWTDMLITINQEDYECAKRKLHARHAEIVPGVGVDLSKFNNQVIDRSIKRSQMGIRDSMIWIHTTGELIPRKNHEVLIKAAAEIPNAYLTIAGKGPLYEYLGDLIKELHAEDRMSLLGLRKDIAELCCSADVFSLPSFHEGLSVALMEAMACGLPCAVSKIRGNIDLIDENGGELFDPHSVEECKQSLLRIINSDRTQMGRHNREKVKAYDMLHAVAAIKRIYDEI